MKELIMPYRLKSGPSERVPGVKDKQGVDMGELNQSPLLHIRSCGEQGPVCVRLLTRMICIGLALQRYTDQWAWLVCANFAKQIYHLVLLPQHRVTEFKVQTIYVQPLGS